LINQTPTNRKAWTQRVRAKVEKKLYTKARSHLRRAEWSKASFLVFLQQCSSLFLLFDQSLRKALYYGR